MAENERFNGKQERHDSVAMLESMNLLLIHSPLVTKETWLALVASLEAEGIQSSVAVLDNNPAQNGDFFEHHITQIESSLAPLAQKNVIVVAHSGAGNLLALLDPDRFAGHIFLDAIFPTEQGSRFDLFDDPRIAKSWQRVANQHTNMLPRSMLIRIGEQIKDRDARDAFVAKIVDVPVEVYEELIPVHPNWPRSKRGLYIQWTDGYSADAARAEKAGFEVRHDPALHFKMLDEPDEVAHELVRFARENFNSDC